MLAAWLAGTGTDLAQSVANPLGSGTVRLLVVPIGGEAEQGVLVTGSQLEGFPGELDHLLLDSVAKQVTTLLQYRQTKEALVQRDIAERKQAEEALRDSAARLRALSRRVVEIQEQERRHVARELHDEIGQVLSAISVNLHAVKRVCDAAAWPRIEESIQIVDQATQQVRNLSLDLRPSMLDDLGLVATLRWYVDRQAQRAGLAVHFAAESSAASLPTELTTACFRVAQEALTNVVAARAGATRLGRIAPGRQRGRSGDSRRRRRLRPGDRPPPRRTRWRARPAGDPGTRRASGRPGRHPV